jgi:hypothetical protein
MTAAEPAPAPFNFGPVSTRDTLLYTCERPGNASLEDTKSSSATATVTATTQADPAEVAAWFQFMRSKGVTDVVVLMDKTEYAAAYEAPGLLQLYTDANLQYLVQPMTAPEARRRIYEYIRPAAVVAADVNVTTDRHCTGGVGRACRDRVARRAIVSSSMWSLE